MNSRAYTSENLKHTNDPAAPAQPKHTAISKSYLCSMRGQTPYIKQPHGLQLWQTELQDNSQGISQTS